MSKIDFLKEQIIEARTFVNRLMSELPEDLWYVIPEGTDSNFIWQVGHLLVSQNFHTLTAVTGVNEKVGRLVPIQKYNRIFNGMGTLHRSIEKDLIPVAELREQTEIVHQICVGISIASQAWEGRPMPASTMMGRSISSMRIWMKSRVASPLLEPMGEARGITAAAPASARARAV